MRVRWRKWDFGLGERVYYPPHPLPFPNREFGASRLFKTQLPRKVPRMAQMAKVTINWTGFPGGPGYSNLYFRDFSGTGAVDQGIVDGAVAKVQDWLSFWRNRLPTSVKTGVDPTVEAIEETTGELQGFWTATVAAPAGGLGVASFSAPSGACVSWYTSTVRNGRRMRGRTFIVPLDTVSYENDGTLIESIITAAPAVNNAMIADSGAGDLGIWARPSAPGASDGQWALVTAARLNDRPAMLTSRRD